MMCPHSIMFSGGRSRIGLDCFFRDVGDLGNALLNPMKQPRFHLYAPPLSNITSDPYQVRPCRFASEIPVVLCNLVEDHLGHVACEAKFLEIYGG